MKNPYFWAIAFIIYAGLFSRCSTSYKDGWNKTIGFAVRGCTAGGSIFESNQQRKNRITTKECKCLINKAAQIYSMEEFAEIGIDFILDESSVTRTTRFSKLKNAARSCRK